MQAGMLAFSAGVIGALALPFWPDGFWLCALAVLALRCLMVPSVRWLALFGVGVIWGLLQLASQLEHRLPGSLVGQDLLVTGDIVTIPVTQAKRQRFELAVHTCHSLQQTGGASCHQLRKIRLSWFRAPPLRVGERWQLQVRLRPPRAYQNPGGFDYARWLLARRIDATGYVRASAMLNKRQMPAEDGIAAWRQWLSERIVAVVADPESAALLKAITLGERQGISAAQWQVLSRTGTTHLMVISGLHIAIVAGGSFWLLSRLLRPLLRWSLPLPAVAAVGAMLAATLYSAAAGFSLPTQRALVMTLAGLLALVGYRSRQPLPGLALALAAVLLWDPLAPLMNGFWLSFGAVALLLYGLGGRLRATSWHWRWWRPQWVIFIGLTPLLLDFNGAVSGWAPLVNMLAIPLVGGVLTPLALLAVLLLTLWPAAGEPLLWLAAEGMALYWQGLTWVAGWELGVWRADAVSPMALAALLFGALLLLAPRGMPGRQWGWLALLPVLWPPSTALPPGALRTSVLDVGQGLAVVVETRDHALLYDVGPAFRSGFNTAEAVVMPVLRQYGIEHLDALVISHDDQDHAGGVGALLRRLPVTQVWSGSHLPGLESIRSCRAGTTWRWNQVTFRFLHPQGTEATDNDRSCVLAIDNGAGSVLLTGDIGVAVERRLVEHWGERLRATLLVAPHHGSRSSSSSHFIAAVRPDLVLFTAGYRNHFGHPHEQVVQRYLAQGSRALNTADEGAVMVTFAATSATPDVKRWRSASKRLWRQYPP